MATNSETTSTTNGVLKTASVISRVLFEIVQQAKQTQEQVGVVEEAILSLESTLQKVDEKDEQKLNVILSAVVLGLERTHEIFQRLDRHRGEFLFREEKEIQKLANQTERLLILCEALLKDIQQPTSSFESLFLLKHSSAKEFWMKHFGNNVNVVKWDKFKIAVEEELGPQTARDLGKVKRILDKQNDDSVSIFDFGDFSDEDGFTKSYNRVTKKYMPDLHGSKPDNLLEPFQANTLWRGICSQASCTDFDIALQIKEKTPENKFEGIVYWNDPEKTQTKVRGEFGGNMIRFEEYKVIQGSGLIPFPNSYEGKLETEQSTVIGTWTCNEQKGDFVLVLDLEASIRQDEKPKSPRFDRAAHVSERAVISGFLVKQGKLRKNWKSRFFVLEAGYLTYYSNMEAYPSKPSGRIDLRHVTEVKERENIGPKSMLFEITENRRTYYIQAESDQKRKEWIDALKLEMKRLGK